MVTLYQKYRPSNFEEIVNQNHIKITLQNEIETNQIAHAYLFSGPRGTGKTTMARVYAKALNCENRKDKQSEPCCECNSCQQIKNGASLDIIEIDAASHTGVDNVRDNIIASARIAVSGDKYKVFIIDEVHMLSISAFNALLKILEEPPKKVIFILATTEVHKLPTTIISRCQRFDFKRISINDIVKKLDYITTKEEIKADKQVLETIARQSEGHMRDAESLLGQVISISGDEVTQEKADLVIPRSNLQAVIELVEFIERKDSAGAIRLINQLIDEGIDLKNFTKDFIEVNRKMLLIKVSPQLAEKFALDLGQILEEKIRPLVEKLSIERLVNIINKFTKAQSKLKTANIIQLPLEISIVSLIDISITTTQVVAPALVPVNNDVTRPINQPVNNAPAQEAPPVPAGPVDVEDIKSRWNELLINVKKHNHSLSFILRVCEPRNQDGQLCLVFKYKFHQDRVGQAEIRAIIEKSLQDVFNNKITYTTLLDENLAVAEAPAPATPPETPATPPAPVPTPPAPVETPPAPPVEDKPIEEEVKAEVTLPTTRAGKEEVKSTDNDQDIENVLKMFGGKVVN